MISKKKISIVLVLVVVISLLSIWFKSTKEIKVEYLSASWIEGYGSVQDISSQSDLIALVEVDSLLECNGVTIPESIYAINILEAVKGCKTGDQIKIYMTGGIVNNVKKEIIDDPLMKAGEEFFVFAKKNQDGTYSILGGPAGRLVHEDGILNSLHYMQKKSKNADTVETKAYQGMFDVKDMKIDSIISDIVVEEE